MTLNIEASVEGMFAPPAGDFSPRQFYFRWVVTARETEWRDRAEREREGRVWESFLSLLDMSAESSWLGWSQSVSRSSDMDSSGDNWPQHQCQRNTQSGRRLSCKDERELERVELKRGGSLRVNLTTDHLALPTTAKLTDIQVKVDSDF